MDKYMQSYNYEQPSFAMNDCSLFKNLNRYST
jgi:hypothetical protein